MCVLIFQNQIRTNAIRWEEIIEERKIREAKIIIYEVYIHIK